MNNTLTAAQEFAALSPEQLLPGLGKPYRSRRDTHPSVLGRVSPDGAKLPMRAPYDSLCNVVPVNCHPDRCRRLYRHLLVDDFAMARSLVVNLN